MFNCNVEKDGTLIDNNWQRGGVTSLSIQSQ